MRLIQSACAQALNAVSGYALVALLLVCGHAAGSGAACPGRQLSCSACFMAWHGLSTAIALQGLAPASAWHGLSTAIALYGLPAGCGEPSSGEREQAAAQLRGPQAAADRGHGGWGWNGGGAFWLGLARAVGASRHAWIGNWPESWLNTPTSWPCCPPGKLPRQNPGAGCVQARRKPCGHCLAPWPARRSPYATAMSTSCPRLSVP